jgi:ribosome-binding protein aMBF1 (putative translation factor)
MKNFTKNLRFSQLTASLETPFRCATIIVIARRFAATTTCSFLLIAHRSNSGHTVSQMRNKLTTSPDPRRGAGPADEAYLQTVGHRVRSERQRLSLSRRALAESSGVSERYLAELERGAGNASLLVLRQVAKALQVRVEYLASEQPAILAHNMAAE